MASLVTNQGLQIIADRASGIGTPPAAIQTMSIDDGTIAFAATHTTLSTGGAPTNEFDKAFDATPTRFQQTVSHVMTLATGDYNQPIKRIAVHNAVPASVSMSSATLVAGIDNQSIAKAATFALTITVQIVYSNV